MQIKRRGKKLVFIRFVYDQERKRTVNRSLGTQAIYLDHLTDELKGKMTYAEILQADAWFDEQKKAALTLQRDMSVLYMSKKIDECAASVADAEIQARILDRDVADEIYDSIKVLTAALRQAGYKRARAATDTQNLRFTG